MSRTTEMDPGTAPNAGSLAVIETADADSDDESDLDEELLIEERHRGMCGVRPSQTGRATP